MESTIDTGTTIAEDSSTTDTTPAIDSSTPDTGTKDTFIAKDTLVEDTTPADTALPESDAGKPDLLCSRAAGGLTCTSEQVCCWNEEFGVGTCKSKLTACASGSARINCTGRVDCDDGKICCGTFLSTGRLLNSACATTCATTSPDYYAKEVCSFVSPMGECGIKTCLGGDRPFGFCG
jgi:hypothetical protein